MKAAFHTLGCKVNQYETEAMRQQFETDGFDIVDENDFADVYIIKEQLAQLCQGVFAEEAPSDAY